jgi:hypothetical protein
MFDHYAVTEPNAGVWYGIVQAVNQLVVNHDFEVIGFAFRKDSFATSPSGAEGLRDGHRTSRSPHLSEERSTAPKFAGDGTAQE